MNAIGRIGWICGVCGAGNNPDNKLCASYCHQTNKVNANEYLNKQMMPKAIGPGIQQQFPVGGLAQNGVYGDQPVNHDRESHIPGY